MPSSLHKNSGSCAALTAVSFVITPLRASLAREASIVMLPSAAEVAREFSICGVFPSRIRFFMALLSTMTSHASTLPSPDFFGRKGFYRFQTQLLRQQVVDTARRRVQIGMHTDGRNAVPD